MLAYASQPPTQVPSIPFHRLHDLAAVKLQQQIGSGGFGAVCRGTFNGIDVAVKLVPERVGDKEAMRDALELAVLSTISHPNILQVDCQTWLLTLQCMTAMRRVGLST